MEKTLIIYDSMGTIIHQMRGFYNLPEGLPYLEVIIPEGKYVSKIDITCCEPIFEDIPKSQTEILEDKISILELGLANAEYSLMMGGLL